MKNHSHFNPTFQPLQQLTQNETKIKNQAGIKSLCSSQTPSVLLSSAERGKHLHYWYWGSENQHSQKSGGRFHSFLIHIKLELDFLNQSNPHSLHIEASMHEHVQGIRFNVCNGLWRCDERWKKICRSYWLGNEMDWATGQVKRLGVSRGWSGSGGKKTRYITTSCLPLSSPPLRKQYIWAISNNGTHLQDKIL